MKITDNTSPDLRTGFTFLRNTCTLLPMLSQGLPNHPEDIMRDFNDITATELPLDQPSKASRQLAITNHRGKHYLSSRLSYHANSSSTFQLTRLSTSGDINPNPGLAAEENTTTNCALCVPEPSPVTIESSTVAYAGLWAILSAQKSPLSNTGSWFC